MARKNKAPKKKPVWKGRKRNAIGLPLTFTKYILYDNKLVIRKGFLNIVEDEVELYKVKDKQIRISFWGRIFNYGTIQLYASAVYNCDNILKNVHKVRMVAGLLRNILILSGTSIMSGDGTWWVNPGQGRESLTATGTAYRIFLRQMPVTATVMMADSK